MAVSRAAAKPRWPRVRTLRIPELGAAGAERSALWIDCKRTIISRRSCTGRTQASFPVGEQTKNTRSLCFSCEQPLAVLYGFSGKGELLREDHNVRANTQRGKSRGIRGLLLQPCPRQFCRRSWDKDAGKNPCVPYELNKEGTGRRRGK